MTTLPWMRAARVGPVGLALLVYAAPTAAQEACESAFIQAQDRRDAGDLVGARGELRLCMNACATTIGAQCEAWLRDVEARIAHIDLVVDPADAVVAVDDLPVPPGGVDVNPGVHRIAARHPSRRPHAAQIEVAPGQRIAHRVALEPLPAEPVRPIGASPPPRSSPLGIGLIVGGAVLTAAGAGLFVASQIDAQQQKYGDGEVPDGEIADDQWACFPDDCDRTRLVGLWVAAGTSTAIGLALAATGVVVVTSSPSSERAISTLTVEPHVAAAGADGVGLALRGRY